MSSRSRRKELDHLLGLPYRQFEMSSLENTDLEKEEYLEMLQKVRHALNTTPNLSAEECFDLCKKERFLMNEYLKKIVHDKTKF